MWFVLFLGGVPLYIPALIIKTVFIKHNLNKLLVSAAVICLVISKVLLGPRFYVEYSDAILWCLTILFLYTFTQMKMSHRQLRVAFIGYAIFHITSGFCDIFASHFLGNKLISFLPNIVEIRVDDKYQMNLGPLFTFRMQGFFSEPSYFGIVSIFLYTISRRVFSSDYRLSFAILVTVVWSYSVSALLLLFLFWSSSIFIFLKKHLMRSLIVLIILTVTIYFEQNLWNQLVIKITGEHVSGLARVAKLVTGVSIFLERPILGYQPGYFVSIGGTQPGNVYLTILIEFGLIGLVVFSLYIFYIYRKIFRNYYFNILLVQFAALGMMNVSYNPIFYLPLIFCFSS